MNIPRNVVQIVNPSTDLNVDLNIDPSIGLSEDLNVNQKENQSPMSIDH